MGAWNVVDTPVLFVLHLYFKILLIIRNRATYYHLRQATGHHQKTGDLVIKGNVNCQMLHRN